MSLINTSVELTFDSHSSIFIIQFLLLNLPNVQLYILVTANNNHSTFTM